MSTRNYRSTVKDQLQKIEARRTQDLQILLREQGEAGDDRFDANTVYNMSREELRAAAEEYVDAAIVDEIEAAIEAGFPLDERLSDLVKDAVAKDPDDESEDAPEQPMTSAEIVERLKERHGMTAVDIRDLVNDTIIKEGITEAAGEEPSSGTLEDTLLWTEARVRREGREQETGNLPGFGLDEASDEAVREVVQDAADAAEEGNDLTEEELRARLADVTSRLDSPLQKAIEDAGLVDIADRFREAAEDAQAATNTVKDGIAAAAVAAEREAGRLTDEAVEAARVTIEQATAEAEAALDRVRETTQEAANEIGREADRVGGSVDEAIAEAVADVEATAAAITDLLGRAGDAVNTVGGVQVTFDMGAIIDGIRTDADTDGMASPDPGDAPPPQTISDHRAGVISDRLGASGSSASSGGGTGTAGSTDSGSGSGGTSGGLIGGTDPAWFDKGVVPSGQDSGGTDGGAGGTAGGADDGGAPPAGADEEEASDEWTPGWENVGGDGVSYTKGEDGVWEEEPPLDPETKAQIDADAEADAAADDDGDDEGSVEYTPSGETSGRVRPDATRDQYQAIIREAEANSNINPTREGTEARTGSLADALDSDSLKQPGPDGDLAQPDVVVRGPGFGSAQGDGVTTPTPDSNVQYEEGLGGDVPTDVGRDPGLSHLGDQAGATPDDEAPKPVLPDGVSPADLRIGEDLRTDISDLQQIALPPLATGGMSAIAPTYEDANPGWVGDDNEDAEEPSPTVEATIASPLDLPGTTLRGEVEEPSPSLFGDDEEPSRWDPEPDDDTDESR